MATTLSSRWTPFYKFVIPPLVLGGIGTSAVVAYLHPEPQRMPPGLRADQGWLLLAGATVVVATILWWALRRLMRVELDDDELIISNYRTEIRVPLSNVARIGGPSWSSPPRYTLTFEEPTDLGRTVAFIPPITWTLGRMKERDEVVELRAAWEAARSAKP
ncbi:MAG: hypothetical protein C0497_07575 [Gemmatimonas sp.]|nr:hypothetical protein [Gemmatimonas sp.]